MKISDALGAAALAGVAKLLRQLPLKAALGFGRTLGSVAFFFSNRKRVAYADLKHAFGNRYSEKERWQLVHETYRHFGQMAVEVLTFPNLDLPTVKKNITIYGRDRFDTAIRMCRGVILVTAHFGNWEYLQIVSCILGKPIRVLARQQKHSKLNQYLNKMRESHGSIAVRRGMGVRDLLRGLRRRELIGLLGDQDAGKFDGEILPFFGRKTTVPTGPFELALRTGAPVLPCFMVRKNDEKHDIFVGQLIDLQGSEDSLDREQVIEEGMKQYLKDLESYVQEYPHQWLWMNKRWKYSWTKRILILSDGKAGHVKQAQSLARQFQAVETQHMRPGMEYPTEKVEVRFKTPFHRHLFSWIAWALLPWAQGRIHWLKSFFTEETYQSLLEARGDFVLSAGSSLVPLNLWLARDFQAKSIVVMKPPFPYSFSNYDLVVVPAHDRGNVPKHTLRLLLSPSQMEATQIEKDAEKIAAELKNPVSLQFSIFLGGPTRRYPMDLKDVEDLFITMRRVAKREGDYMVTTSRRTPKSIAQYLKTKVREDDHCQLVVIHNEDKRPEVVGGMIGLADILIVTEDSVSMISEAVSSGKKVIVLDLNPKSLPRKHRCFKEILANQSAVTLATPQNLEQKIAEVQRQEPSKVAELEGQQLRQRLQEIL